MAFDIDEKYIKETEDILGAKLPIAYKRVMSENNGGTLFVDDEDWELFPIPDKADRKRVSRTANSIIYETNKAKEWSNFPRDVLAIAFDGTGDMLVLLKDNTRYKEDVYIWNHETGSLEKIANSFDELEIK